MAEPGDRQRMGRRHLLQAGVSYLIAASWPAPARRARQGKDESERLASALGAFFADPAAVRATGARYLRHHREEAAPELLQAALFGPGRSGLPASVARWMAEHRAHDLEREDIVLIDGWVLARSEARLCALATLLAAA